MMFIGMSGRNTSAVPLKYTQINRRAKLVSPAQYCRIVQVTHLTSVYSGNGNVLTRMLTAAVCVNASSIFN